MFDIGDVVHVRCWDQGDEVWEEGITMITDAGTATHVDRGVYALKSIAGTFNATLMNADYFEPSVTRILGNVKNGKMVELLYG